MKKKILALCGVVILLFAIFNIFWYYNYSSYNIYTNNMKQLPSVNSYLDDDNGVLYNVKKPGYPTFTGNLGVSLENGKYALVIWPKIFEDTEYGIRIEDSEKNMNNAFMVDNNLQAFTKEEQLILSKYKKQINLLKKYKNDRWDIK